MSSEREHDQGGVFPGRPWYNYGLMTARNHHYLPQCYLKGFALDPEKPQLQVFDLEKGKAFKTSVRNIGSERDFNRTELQGRNPDELETTLSKLEAEIEQAIANVVRTGSLANPQDMGLILHLISLLHIRNPRVRDNFGDAMEQVIRFTAQSMVRTRETWDGIGERLGRDERSEDLPFDEMKGFIDSGEYGVAVKREFHIALELKTVVEMIPVLARRNWELLRAGAGSGGFVTTDEPSTLFWTDPKLAEGPYSPGLGLGSTMLLFPLSRDYCLKGTLDAPNGRVPETRELPFLQVAASNGLIVRHANRQVYAADDLFVFTDGSSPVPRVGNELLNRPNRPGHTRRARQPASKPEAA